MEGREGMVQTGEAEINDGGKERRKKGRKEGREKYTTIVHMCGGLSFR